MNKTRITHIITLIIIIIGYYYLMNNLIINSDEIAENNTDTQISINGMVELVGTKDIVTVQITRERWYGTIIEDSGITLNSKLYIFNMLPLPLVFNNINLKVYHFIFLSFILAYIFLILFITDKIERREEIYGNN